MIDSLFVDAKHIWHAGLDAVRGHLLVERSLKLESNTLIIDDAIDIDLDRIDRISLLGGGKAAAGMADGFWRFWEKHGPASIKVSGWLNVPAGTYDSALASRLMASAKFEVQLHPAREPGANEPTQCGVLGSQAMVELASLADERTLVLCLLSGGASALMPAPVPPLTLEDKLALTRFFAQSGADIETINEVRRCLSTIKGGGLARAASSAHQVVSLILSDVLGDPIHLIGSGPTVLEPPPNPALALQLLDQWDPQQTLPSVIRQALWEQITLHGAEDSSLRSSTKRNFVQNYILANNATAVDACGVQAVERGYAYWMESDSAQGKTIEDFAAKLLRGIELAVESQGPDCLILGGEPTVKLPEVHERGVGGRNQQLALQLLNLMQQHTNPKIRNSEGIAVICGGTDGEDGPTLAAGAVITEQVMTRARELKLDSGSYLFRCDANSFFEATGGLWITGPTNTNVCDLSVVVVAR